MIKLELDLSPQQLIAVGIALGGKPIVLDTPLLPTVEELLSHADSETGEIDLVEAFQKETHTGENRTIVTQTPASPAATAFAADVETAEASFNGVELAKGTNGQMIPWDVRIHGKAKKKNADKSWRLIQGVDRDTLVPQVEAELVAALTAPKPVTSAVGTDTQQAGNPALNTTTRTVTDMPAQGATVQEVQTSAGGEVPAPPSASAADKPTTFAELLPLVTAAKAAGTLTDETIASTCVDLGLAQFGLIATRPDLIPRAVELLGV